MKLMNAEKKQPEAAPRENISPGIIQTLYYLGQFGASLDLEDLSVYIDELQGENDFLDAIEEKVAPVNAFETKTFSGIYDFRLYRLAFYALVRAVKPSIFIETGVMHGLSSAFILKALEENGGGKLISIDLPSYAEDGPANQDGYNAILPPGEEPGWAVPDHLRSYWDLKLGKSLEILPDLFKTLPEIDIFCHDSDHSYETMSGELHLAWDHLRDGGILICDNIDHCDAFYDFCKKTDRTPFAFPTPDRERHNILRTGVIKK